MQDNLSGKLQYMQPYLDGVTNPLNRTFRAGCFNSQKLSPVFTGGPGADEVPPVWIDRVGLKANITEVCIKLKTSCYFMSKKVCLPFFTFIIVLIVDITELHYKKQIHVWTGDRAD